MAQKNNNKKGNISGQNIYLDRQGQTVYYNIFDKTGYIIDGNVENKFYLYKNRFFLVVIIIILFSEYFPGWIQAVLTGLALGIVAEILFRKKFLPSLRVARNFKPENKKTMLKTIVEAGEVKKTVLRAMLYAAFAVLIVANAVMMDAGVAMLGASIVLCIFAAYCALINVVALFKMKK